MPDPVGTPPAQPISAPPVAPPAAAAGASPSTPPAPPAGTAPAQPVPPGSPPAQPVGGATPGTGSQTIPTPPPQYDLKPPADSKLDAASVERTAATARSLGLSQEQAQKLLEHDAQFAKSYHEGLLAQHANTVKAWETESRNDPEFGGASFDAHDARAGQLIERFGSPKFKEQLKATGFQWHPEFRRFVTAIAKELAPSTTFPAGRPPAPPPKSSEEVRYPKMFQQKKAATADAAA